MKQPRNPSKADARFVSGLAISVSRYLVDLWRLSYVQKTAKELTREEKEDLAEIVLGYRDKGEIKSFDKLAYSKVLERVRTDFLQKTGVRPAPGELYHAILNLRKSGRLAASK